jgi:heme exporter protein B
MFSQIKHLIQKEVMLEWKQKYSFNGILLYVVATVFVCYLSFRQIIDPPTWNALFWIILLFAAVNAVAKSFLQESRGRQLYLYIVVSPQALILSKIIYNLLLMFVISLVTLFFYCLFVGNLVQDLPMFILGLLLGSAGFASVLTMVSAIASRAGNNSTLMAILSFPILIPLLMTIIRFSKNAMDGLDSGINYQFIIMLLALNVIIVTLSFLLFPYLWRE